MENASKALIMAAGVLIAMLVIAAIYLLFDQIAVTQNADDAELKRKQIEEFNKDFESYEKRMLRGTDLVTVINKAVANNEKYRDDDKSLHINIVFTLQTDISEVKIKIVDAKREDPVTTTILKKDEDYNLISYKNGKLVINSKITGLMDMGVTARSNTDNGRIVNMIDDRNYTKIYDSFEAFKRKIFGCVNVEYNSDGRIVLMRFEELEKSSEFEDFV